MSNGVDPSFLAQIANSGNTTQAPQEQDDTQQRSSLMRAVFAQRIGRNRREEKKLTKELDNWKEELAANERKKGTCIGLLIMALADDTFDVFAAFASFGLLQTVTFFIPGLIRMFVAIHEREPRPDRFIRAVLAMAIEAIPWINLLPTTTVNLIIDFLEASWDADQAKNKVEELEKKIKTLKQTTSAQSRSAASVFRAMAQSAQSRRAA